MNKLYLLLLLATYSCVTSRKVDRYYFVAEEQIPLYEFASFKGRPVLTANVGDTIASTNRKSLKNAFK